METTERPTQQSTNTPEIFTQQWPHIRQQVKSWWDRLTDADLDQVAGQKERLVRALEARYGYARERAEQEVDRQLAEFYKTLETSQGGRLVEAASSAAHGVASTFAKTAGEVGTTAQKIAAYNGNQHRRYRGSGRYLPARTPRWVGGIHPSPSLAIANGRYGPGLSPGAHLCVDREASWRGGAHRSARGWVSGRPDSVLAMW